MTAPNSMLCLVPDGRLCGLLLVLVVGTAACDGGEPDGASSSLETVRGDLGQRVETLREAMPRRDADGFRAPTATDLDRWRALTAHLLDGETTAARSLVADAFPSYALVRFRDTTVDRTYLFLREAPVVERGWGSVVVTPSPDRALAVEVPHPVFDLDTHRQGAVLFRESGARMLLLAGTHRCSNRAASPCDGQTGVCHDGTGPYRVSDMAHAATTPFQATHEEATDRAPALTTLSLHGNGNASCETVFLSAGVPDTSTARLDALARALDERGVDVGVPSASSCPLVGSTNVQGRYTNGASSPCTEAADTATGRFVHIEQRRPFRASAAEYGALIEAVNTVFDDSP
jgi:hypothetical protein